MPGIFLNEAIVLQTAKKVASGVKRASPYIIDGANKAGEFAINHKDELERAYHIGSKFKNGEYNSDIKTIKHDILNAPENIANGVKNAANSAVTSIRGY